MLHCYPKLLTLSLSVPMLRLSLTDADASSTGSFFLISSFLSLACSFGAAFLVLSFLRSTGAFSFNLVLSFLRSTGAFSFSLFSFLSPSFASSMPSAFCATVFSPPRSRWRCCQPWHTTDNLNLGCFWSLVKTALNLILLPLILYGVPKWELTLGTAQLLCLAARPT